MRDTVSQPFLDNLFGELCQRLRQEGLPLTRATMHLRTLHPQFQGARVLWRVDLPEPELGLLEHGIFDDPRFVNSPVSALYEGADGFRQRLDLPNGDGGSEFSIYADLRAEGYTDYVALPMQFTDGKRHAERWSTTSPGGFTTERPRSNQRDPAGAARWLVEIRANRRITREPAQHLCRPARRRADPGGRYQARRAVQPSRRRSGSATCAASPAISDSWPRDDVIALLNDYFDCMAAPVSSTAARS